MTGVSLRKHLQKILEEKMLPAARGEASLMLLRPPLLASPEGDLQITSVPAAPLPKARPRRSHIALHQWPDQFLNSLRVPYLACVFEGEADIMTALTAEQAREHAASRGPKSVFPFGRQIISMPATGFFLVPPGAPVSFGSRPHWERDEPQAAYSRIFWIHLVPSGAFCHTCISSRGKHRTHPFVFVANDQLPVISQLLLNEMLRSDEQSWELSRTLLLSLLLKLSDALSREKTTLLATGESIESAAALRPGAELKPAASLAVNNDSVAVQRALTYLESNLNQHLTPALIAERSYISVSHLHRLFQAELNTSVMEYVIQLRLNKASSLLAETDLPIAEIAELSGYKNASHFSQLFTRHQQCSPRDFRKQRQKQQAFVDDILTPR